MRQDAGSFEFDWDRGNAGKNAKHGVGDSEAEEPFFDENKVMLRDALHSGTEDRFLLLGKTKQGVLLFVAFTKRGDRVRIISARRANRKEFPLYEKAS